MDFEHTEFMKDWISVKDRLPELEMPAGFYRCLVFNGQRVFEAMWNPRVKVFMHSDFSKIFPSHWMPLPEPPKN